MKSLLTKLPLVDEDELRIIVALTALDANCREKALTVDEIQDRTGTPPARIRRACDRLRDWGVARSARGKWSGEKGRPYAWYLRQVH